MDASQEDQTTHVKFNLLQQSKVAAYLYSFKARPGMRLAQCDLSSIEPRIVAEFSRDRSLLNLYGRDAKPQDVYLYNAAHIALFSDEIRAHYDPENPTKETIAAAKAACKKTRQFNKAITLACGYGAGVKKIRSMLITMGFPVTMQEATIIHRDYWKLYAGIKDFQGMLEDMWRDNLGWFPNVSGRPICVPPGDLHNVVNRFAQSSGHDVLLKFLYYTEQLRAERGLPFQPWVPDWHDEQILEIPASMEHEAAMLFHDALELVNRELEMEVRIEGEPQFADNLAEIKTDPEDYEAFLKEWNICT